MRVLSPTAACLCVGIAGKVKQRKAACKTSCAVDRLRSKLQIKATMDACVPGEGCRVRGCLPGENG